MGLLRGLETAGFACSLSEMWAETGASGDTWPPDGEEAVSPHLGPQEPPPWGWAGGWAQSSLGAGQTTVVKAPGTPCRPPAPHPGHLGPPTAQAGPTRPLTSPGSQGTAPRVRLLCFCPHLAHLWSLNEDPSRQTPCYCVSDGPKQRDGRPCRLSLTESSCDLRPPQWKQAGRLHLSVTVLAVVLPGLTAGVPRERSRR